MDGFDPVIGQQEDFLEPPNIHDLFVHYSDLYFENCLGACSVEWSVGRMTRYMPSCFWPILRSPSLWTASGFTRKPSKAQ